MARTFYSLVFCTALGLLATMWLRPGVAQELIDMARGVRMQSPDPVAGAPQYSTPTGLPSSPVNVPYSNVPGPPNQPMPVARPSSWPGAASDLYNTAPNNSAPPNRPITNTLAPPSGVTVWDPNGNHIAAASPPAGASLSPLPPYANPARAADSPVPNVASIYAAPPAPVGAGGYPTTMPTQAPPGNAYPSTGFNAPAAADPMSLPAAQGYPANQNYPASQGYPTAQGYPTTQQFAPPAAGQLPQSGVQPAQSDAGQLAPPADAAAVAPNPNMQNLQLLPSQPQDLTDAKVMAKCGNEVILRGDCDVQIAEFLAKQKVEVPPDRLEDQYEVLRRPVLKQLIEQKLVYADVIKQVPAAGMTKIEGNINEQFDKQQLPELMKTNNATTRQELDDKLRQRGSSIDRERRNYFERQLVMGWMGEKVKKDVEISLSDILGYYWQHIDDYKYPAQARWEELMVSFNQYPDKGAAFAALAQMGNQVMQGASLAEVAKAGSQGPTASSGGSYDWTNQGSLASKEIDEQIFSLPVGSLSKIFETSRGWHIVRVIERKPAGKKSFEDAQTAIKDQLKKENIKSQVDKYLSEVKKKTPVWTIYDDQPGGLEGPKQPEQHPNFE